MQFWAFYIVIRWEIVIDLEAIYYFLEDMSEKFHVSLCKPATSDF